MNKELSNCCGAEIMIATLNDEFGHIAGIERHCYKCHKPCPAAPKELKKPMGNDSVEKIVKEFEAFAEENGMPEEEISLHGMFLTSKLEIIKKEAYERGKEEEHQSWIDSGWSKKVLEDAINHEKPKWQREALAQGRAEMKKIAIAAVQKLKTAQLRQPLSPDQIMRDALVNQAVYQLQSLQ